MLKNCEDRTCSSGDMFADRQTRRQTERRAHHNTPLPYRQSSNNLSPMSARESAGRRIRCRIAWQKQCCIGRSVLEAIDLRRRSISYATITFSNHFSNAAGLMLAACSLMRRQIVIFAEVHGSQTLPACQYRPTVRLVEL